MLFKPGFHVSDKIDFALIHSHPAGVVSEDSLPALTDYFPDGANLKPQNLFLRPDFVP